MNKNYRESVLFLYLQLFTDLRNTIIWWESHCSQKNNSPGPSQYL